MLTKKYKVYANVTFNCSREVEAFDENDALEQCLGMSGEEWASDFSFDDSHVELDFVAEVKPKARKARSKVKSE